MKCWGYEIPFNRDVYLSGYAPGCTGQIRVGEQYMTHLARQSPHTQWNVCHTCTLQHPMYFKEEQTQTTHTHTHQGRWVTTYQAITNLQTIINQLDTVEEQTLSSVGDPSPENVFFAEGEE